MDNETAKTLLFLLFSLVFTVTLVVWNWVEIQILKMKVKKLSSK